MDMVESVNGQNDQWTTATGIYTDGVITELQGYVVLRRFI